MPVRHIAHDISLYFTNPTPLTPLPDPLLLLLTLEECLLTGREVLDANVHYLLVRRTKLPGLIVGREEN